MIKLYNPEEAPGPVSPTYSQVAEIPPGMITYHISGQVGVDASGKALQGAEAQLEQIWSNLIAILRSQGMGPENIVKITSFLTRKEDISIARQARERALGSSKPASTLLLIAGLASPDYLAEIELIAAK